MTTSRGDQHPESQHDRLTAAGCERIYIDKASGTLSARPEFDRALDQSIDTTTPEGRLFFHILAAFAELERDMIAARNRRRGTGRTSRDRSHE